MDFRNCDLITEIQDRSWYTDIKQRKGAGGMAAMNMNREQFDEMIRSGKTFLVDYWAALVRLLPEDRSSLRGSF